MLDLLAGFVGELRAAGLPVSLTENVDAMDAVRHVPLDDRAALRTAMAATMVKRREHRPAFDAVFDSYFALRPTARLESADDVDVDVTESTLHVLLKHRADIAAAARELKTAG